MTENRHRILKESNPHIFRPVKFRSVEARNRIMMSPMCQYSATDGIPEEWHHVHLCSRAVGGAGIVFTEATHVSPEGELHQIASVSGIMNNAMHLKEQHLYFRARSYSSYPIGHAGRKASTSRPWEGTRSIFPKEPGAGKPLHPPISRLLTGIHQRQ